MLQCKKSRNVAFIPLKQGSVAHATDTLNRPPEDDGTFFFASRLIQAIGKHHGD